jgi:hypothetical protein
MIQTGMEGRILSGRNTTDDTNEVRWNRALHRGGGSSAAFVISRHPWRAGLRPAETPLMTRTRPDGIGPSIAAVVRAQRSRFQDTPGGPDSIRPTDTTGDTNAARQSRALHRGGGSSAAFVISRHPWRAGLRPAETPPMIRTRPDGIGLAMSGDFTATVRNSNDALGGRILSGRRIPPVTRTRPDGIGPSIAAVVRAQRSRFQDIPGGPDSIRPKHH